VQYFVVGLCGLIGSVFLLAVAGKLAGRDGFGAFVASVQGMRVLPPRLVRPAALLVVAAEVAVCVLLAVPAPVTRAAGFVIAVGLLVAFMIGTVTALRRGVRTPCRCFGMSTTPLGLRQVVRNAVLTAVAACGAVASVSTYGPIDPAGAAVAAVAGLVLGGLVTAADDLVELFRPVDLGASGNS
jgi:methylamine utilization protein MauE